MDQEESLSESLLDLCDFCQTLANELSKHPSTWDHETLHKDIEPRSDRVYRKYISGTTLFDLFETEGSCRLCGLIISSLKSQHSWIDPYQDFEPTAGPIEVGLQTFEGKLVSCYLAIPMNMNTRVHLRIDIIAIEGIYSLRTPRRRLVNTILGFTSYMLNDHHRKCCSRNGCSENYITSELLPSMLKN